MYILIIFVILVFLLIWYFLDALFCKEDYVTNKDTIKKLATFLNNHYPKKLIFYDLGSSMGGFVLNLAEKCPQLQIIGVDNSLLRILISKLRA